MNEAKYLSAVRRRRMNSALWWMAMPAAVLLPFRDTALSAAICGSTPNLSYDGMLIAAGFGVGLAQLLLSRRTGLDVQDRVGHALDVFEVAVMAALAALYAQAGIYGSALVWSVGLGITGVGLLNQRRAERHLADSVRPCARPRTALDLIASALLLSIAVIFIAFPVTKPWTGPVEPFVRWHPFSPEIETVWRGIFASFAVAMAVAALDPGHRHRHFLLALGCSGICHAAFMAADNLLAAWYGRDNGNVEHLYGDVAGWLLIGLASLAYWRARRIGAAPV